MVGAAVPILRDDLATVRERPVADRGAAALGGGQKAVGIGAGLGRAEIDDHGIVGPRRGADRAEAEQQRQQQGQKMLFHDEDSFP